jgi:exonuclease III
MKIITWNCSGAFRKKICKIKELNPDIMVIQECENPEKYMDKIDKENKFNFYWTGHNQHKGLGVFYTSDQKVEKLEGFSLPPRSSQREHTNMCLQSTARSSWSTVNDWLR